MIDVPDELAEGSFRQLIQRIAPWGRFLRAWRLSGGVSALVTALEVEWPDGATHKLIVRQHGAADLRANPHIARDEYRLLQIAQAHGLPAPQPYGLDDICDLFPTPVLVIEFVDGETELEPANVDDYLRQMATELVKIHRVRDTAELAFLPRVGRGFGERPAQLDDALNEDRIRDALESAWPVPQVNASVLLHGDYWPGNLLWSAGNLAAVIDWEDASVGDPLADLGNARLEALFFFGAGAMDAFTRHYLSQSDIDPTNLPWWDLRAALRPCSKLATWGLDAETEAAMRSRHSAFVAAACDQLRGGLRH